jgi:hypothetical protein
MVSGLALIPHEKNIIQAIFKELFISKTTQLKVLAPFAIP